MYVTASALGSLQLLMLLQTMTPAQQPCAAAHQSCQCVQRPHRAWPPAHPAGSTGPTHCPAGRASQGPGARPCTAPDTPDSVNPVVLHSSWQGSGQGSGMTHTGMIHVYACQEACHLRCMASTTSPAAVMCDEQTPKVALAAACHHAAGAPSASRATPDQGLLVAIPGAACSVSSGTSSVVPAVYGHAHIASCSVVHHARQHRLLAGPCSSAPRCHVHWWLKLRLLMMHRELHDAGLMLRALSCMMLLPHCALAGNQAWVYGSIGYCSAISASDPLRQWVGQHQGQRRRYCAHRLHAGRPQLVVGLRCPC